MPAQSTFDIIDFHTHLRPTGWVPPATRNGKPAFSLPAETVQKFTDVDLLIQESEEGDVALRLLSSTIEGLFGIEGPTDIDEIRRQNDWLAETVGRHPDRLAALATIDAFSGDVGAREAERAIVELGHVGIVIDSARDELFPGESIVRPTLELAAGLKVPVLVHPVAAPNADALVRGAGVPGNSFGRGLINGVAFLSLLHSGVLQSLPDLHVVFTAIGTGALVMAAAESDEYAAEARAAGHRPNVYFDIMGLDPSVIRFLVDFLGAERVVVGSDWPIWAPVTRRSISAAFAAAGLSAAQQVLVAHRNARRLLDLRTDGRHPAVIVDNDGTVDQTVAKIAALLRS